MTCPHCTRFETALPLAHNNAHVKCEADNMKCFLRFEISGIIRSNLTDALVFPVRPISSLSFFFNFYPFESLLLFLLFLLFSSSPSVLCLTSCLASFCNSSLAQRDQRTVWKQMYHWQISDSTTLYRAKHSIIFSPLTAQGRKKRTGGGGGEDVVSGFYLVRT